MKATRVNGTVRGNFELRQVYLDDLEGLDGHISTQSITAINVFDWPVSAGVLAKAEYNEAKDQWELYQLQVQK